MADHANITRRSLLRAAPAAAFTPAIIAAAQPSPHERVERAAREMEAAMRAIHGGKWMVLIDHEAKVVAVAQTFEKGGVR